MRSIKASEFKARCLKLMDEVATSGESIEITKNGKPVAQLTPVQSDRPLFGFLSDDIEITGDIEGPTGESWGALAD